MDAKVATPHTPTTSSSLMPYGSCFHAYCVVMECKGTFTNPPLPQYGPHEFCKTQ